jgi:diaminobutyrate-2-oxoglutarate transaminase
MSGAELRGIGMLRGLRWRDPEIAPAISRNAFGRGLIAETCGALNDVLKLLPPLVIESGELGAGLNILEESLRDVLGLSQRANAA